MRIYALINLWQEQAAVVRAMQLRNFATLGRRYWLACCHVTVDVAAVALAAMTSAEKWHRRQLDHPASMTGHLEQQNYINTVSVSSTQYAQHQQVNYTVNKMNYSIIWPLGQSAIWTLLLFTNVNMNSPLYKCCTATTGAALDGKNASPSITYHPRWLPLSRV